ncbi:DUF3413 domain-containing protein [Shewanella submarina]|uniref:DUF3413 domain-containing protein n=1 Tax=Shewanella submarina TaxID=2016376 RepID=A0ABV7GAD7_9GAMM|nr:DUF3413 domain-containing protein [Shewanella submarina]MCL1037635.1 DUF3413 domain-containing protein [Shewanella submarina]
MVERQKQMSRDKISRLVNWGHWFAFFNGILAMLIGSRYLDSIGYPDSVIGWGYLAISTIGHFSFLAFMVYLVFLFPISTLLPYSKILRGYAALVATASLCILLYDTIVFDDYGMHLSPFAFDLAWADLSALLHGTSYIATPIAILAIELTAANFIWKRIDKIQKKHWGPKVVAFVGLCFVSSHLIHIWADAKDITQITRFDDTYPLSYPATAKTFIARHGLETQKPKAEISNVTTLHYPKSPLQCSADEHPNVLIIAIDSLRYDMVTKETMPFLTQYAAQNQQFSHHLSGGNHYASGMFSLLYGLQGSYQDAVDFNVTSPLLTQTFKQSGYEMGLFISQSDLDEVQPAAMMQDFTPTTANDKDSNAGADIQLTGAFEQWQQTQTAPWFALLDLKSPENYDTPIGFLGVETIKAPEGMKPAERVLFNQYRQSLNFIDKLLAETLANLPEDTLVVITGIKGKVFTSNSSEARQDLSPANVRVPMIIHWPEGKQGNIQYRTTHAGLVPTLMTQVLGCTNPPTDYSAGRHLLHPDDQKWNYVGDNKVFAIYQPDEITVINRHGQYYIYDVDYQQKLKKKLSAPELIQVMRESRRLYKE